MASKWDDWMSDWNRRNDIKTMVYIPGAEGWAVSSLLVPAGTSNMVLSLFLAWVVLTLASQNYIVSGIATLTIGMIVTVVLGLIQMLQWGLGPLESILIVIVIGFSVDYTVHLADSYMASSALDRVDRVRDALVHTGVSVLSGAISTLGASIPLFFAQIIFFFKFGVFIFVTIWLSLVFSLGFFAALLSLIGPLGTRGHLSNIYGPVVYAMHAVAVELEEEQAKVDAEQARQRAAMKDQQQPALPTTDAA